MGNRVLLVLLILIYLTRNLFGQQNPVESSILFYNVENLFDIKDNPKTDDDNFTPEGEMHWTNARLNEKLLKISKVILNASDWNVPDLMVLVEIENRYILERLIDQPLLKSFPYKIIHKESPDHRGIDVGFIYNSEHFSPLEYNYYQTEANNILLNTREVLYVAGILNGTDTIHIFGNHWPSRYSGLLETKSMRKTAAAILRNKVDELYDKYILPKIIIVGDFNDNPEDETMSVILRAEKLEQPVIGEKLYNLFYDVNNSKTGTLKYQSQWFIFDQIIVSGSLLSTSSGLYTKPENAKILAFPYLIEEDIKFGGYKPFRTYYGYTYKGGFSDHLPVILRLNTAN